MSFAYWNQTGARLLAGMLTDLEVRELAADVETLDFHHPHQQCAFGTLRNLQAKSMPIGLLEVADEIRRLDEERGTYAHVWVNEIYLARILYETRSYRADFAVERVDGVTHLNGIAIDWDAFLSEQARLSRLLQSKPLTVFDLTDSQKADCKRDEVLADARLLRFYRQHKETLLSEQQQPEQQIPDDHQRIREQRKPNHRRARRSVG